MLYGFGNFHQTEAIENTLPKTQNNPQICALGLYAEQISGSAFTRLRHQNLKTWLYRKLPSVANLEYTLHTPALIQSFQHPDDPTPIRFNPWNNPNSDQTIIESLFHVAGHNSANIYLFDATASMKDSYFTNRDAEMLFIPHQGNMIFHTEMGILSVNPGDIMVIPRGIVFRVELNCPRAKGYMCENHGLPFKLPELGPIGANGLANPRHFEYPSAHFEDKPHSTLITKYQRHLFTSELHHSPLNVVAWMGNYAPYRYDLSLFNTLNTVSFDHSDPSIFTVLTSESEVPGIAHIDFVIFPPRYMVAEHTFRPPYFHRNIMSECMGLIRGEYDAKADGFLPGGLSIHNAFTPHGPDIASFQKGSTQKLAVEKYENTLAFMLETNQPWRVTEQAYQHAMRDVNYTRCWKFR